MRRYLSLRMAIRHFRSDFGAMILSVLAVALGVALVVAVRSMNDAVLSGFFETIDGIAGRASFSVTAGEGLTFAEDLVESVRTVPGVKLAVPLVRAVAFPDDGSGEMLTVHGIDLTEDDAVRLYHASDDRKTLIQDPLRFLNSPDSIILGREFAERRGLKTGDRLDLVTPQGVKPFTIRALLDPEGLARTLRGRLVVMDLFAAERAFTQDEQVNQIDVVADPEDVRGTKERVTAALPPGLNVEEPEVRKDVLRRTIAGFQAMITAFGFLAVLAGFVICYSRLQSIVAARTWEAGLLRAIGVRRLSVFVELLKESLLVGATGAALGLPAGLVVARFGIPVVAATTALNFRLPVPSVDTTITAGSLVLGAIVGVLAALLATLVPALRLARTQPVVALRSRGRELHMLSKRFRWGLRGVLAVGAAALIAWQHVAGHAAIGLVTTAIIVVIAALIAAPLTETACSALFAMCGSVFGPTTRLAVNHLREHPDRTAHTVATLGLGLGTVLLLGMLGWSFERTLVSRLVANERSDMVISSAFASGGYRTAPLAEGVLEDLAKIDGVALAVGQQSTDLIYQNESVVLASCDSACFTDRRIYNWPLDSGSLPGALENVASGKAALVSTSFARAYGIKPGDVLRLDSPNGILNVRVAGITTGSPESAVWMTRDLYKTRWHDNQIWTANVALTPTATYDAVANAVEQSLGTKYRLSILSTHKLIEYFAEEVRRGFALQYLLETVTLVMVAIAIGDALASGIFGRIREIGMMRAIGLQRSDLFRIIVVEGVAIVSIGLMMATITGFLLGAFWVKIEFPALLGWDLDLHFPYAFAAAAGIATLCLGLVASLLPAWHAARLPAATAIRHE